MKKLLSILMCISLAVSVTACGKQSDGTKATGSIEIISPDTVITAEMASNAAGVNMVMDGDVEYDGSARTVTYLPENVGEADPISIRIEQFSDSLTTDQVFNDYEINRIKRTDREYIGGIGIEAYIAYPYICVFDRGCFIKIMAGSGNSQVQKDMLVNLATQAAEYVESRITEKDASSSTGNVIK